MSNPASIFTTELMRNAARRSLSEPRLGRTWRAFVNGWFEFRRLRHDAAVREAVLQLDDHLLRDIGAPEEMREEARYRRERREEPFAPTSARGVESASRRVGW